MNAAEMHHLWGVSVDHSDGQVIVQVGNELAVLEPPVARKLTYWLCHAYYQAEKEKGLPHVDSAH